MVSYKLGRKIIIPFLPPLVGHHHLPQPPFAIVSILLSSCHLFVIVVFAVAIVVVSIVIIDVLSLPVISLLYSLSLPLPLPSH